MSAQRLAVLFDAADEGWVSMEYVGQMLLDALQRDERLNATAHVRTLPLWARRFSQSRQAFNADRAGGRFLTYPLSVLKRRRHFDLFHVVDHSYAHLVHALPTRKTGVYCHDLDAFRSVIEPETLAKPAWFRAMARTQLLGLQRASLVFHSTQAVGAKLKLWVDPSNLVHAPYGVSAEFKREGPGVVDGPYVLHVGSSAARKRIDRVLEIFAAVARARPELRLVQQGATFSDAHREQAQRLGIAGRIVQQGFVDRKTLAALYRKARAVFLPSDAEGFGLPVIEALACGAPVVASDLPTLREAGGKAALYCAPDDLAAWAKVLGEVLDRQAAPSLEERLAHSARFSWNEHARIIANAYLSL